LADYVGADVSAAPTLMLVHSGEELAKYKYEAAITVEALNAYVDNYKAGKL